MSRRSLRIDRLTVLRVRGLGSSGSAEQAIARARPRYATAAERGVVALWLLALGFALHWKLQQLPVLGLDEGVYLAAGKLWAAGRAPYASFLLAHPPLVAFLAAVNFKLGGGVASSRLIAICVMLATCLQLYMLARANAGPSGGFTAMGLYAAAMILVATQGRTFRLELFANWLLVSGAQLWLAGGAATRAWFAGALLGAAVWVKLSSALPLLLLAVGWLAGAGLRVRSRREHVLLVSGVVAAGLVLLLYCAVEPGFWTWAVRAQLERPHASALSRLRCFITALARFPVLLLTWLAAWRGLGRRDPLLRALAVAALGTPLALVLGLGSFFPYYLALCLPWSALVFVSAPPAWMRATKRRITALAVACLGLVAAPVYTSSVLRWSAATAGGEQLVLALRCAPAPLLTSAPILSLWTGISLYDWYYAADNYLPRVNHHLDDAVLASALGGVGTFVLSPTEEPWASGQRTAAVLREQFRVLQVPAPWRAWVRTPQLRPRAPRPQAGLSCTLSTER